MDIDFGKFELAELKPETDFEKAVSEFIMEWRSASKTVRVQTSGSTGAPKIFEIEKEKMLSSAKMTCDFLKLKDGDSALLCLPIEYISGKMMVVRSIFKNLKLKTAEPSTRPLANLEQPIDFCAMTPLQVENSLSKIHLIKKIIIGGASVSESLKEKIFEELTTNPRTENQNFSDENSLKFSNNDLIPNPKNLIPTEIYETYGMSETLSHIALKQIFPRQEGYFQVLDGIDISVDSRGCLEIFAPKLNPNFLKTNDLVEVKNGKEFRFLGRIDNVINSGGAKIFPEELEALVKKEISNEAIFLGIPDEVLGEKLILIIEGKSSDIELPTFNFEKSFHRPKEVVFIEKIPRLPNGKVDRISLKNLVLNLRQ